MDRYSLELPAWISVNDGSDKPLTIEVRTRNICAGGAFVQTEQPLPVETEITMDLILPLDKLQKMGGRRSRIDVSGSVIRTEAEGMAVSFFKNYRIESL